MATTSSESDAIAGVFHVQPTITATSVACSSRRTGASGSPGARDDPGRIAPTAAPARVVGLHYHLHQADYWYVPCGSAACRAARPARRRLADRRRDRGASISGGRTNHPGVYIPPGVAHGFAALTDMTITYLVDGYYNPADELGVAWDDPEIAADWGVADPVLSERDRANPKRAEPCRPTVGPYWSMRTASMRLLVTGGAGFIGANFVRYWSARIRTTRSSSSTR